MIKNSSYYSTIPKWVQRVSIKTYFINAVFYDLKVILSFMKRIKRNLRYLSYASFIIVSIIKNKSKQFTEKI